MAGTDRAAVDVADLRVRFDAVDAVAGVDLSVAAGGASAPLRRVVATVDGWTDETLRSRVITPVAG